MKIELKRFTNNDDGSCNADLYIDQEGTNFIVRYGIISALKNAIAIAKDEYTPVDEPKTTKQSMKEEIESMREILYYYDIELRQKNELITRLQKEPLSEERVHALYRHEMDWRKFARAIELEHGIEPIKESEKELAITFLDEDGYYD